MEDSRDSESESDREQGVYLGCLTKGQLMLCVTAGLVALLIAVTVPAVLLSKNDSSVDEVTYFPTGGDMLDFLVQTGEISHSDGLLATWYHRANNKSEMRKALESDAMILEADVDVDPRTPTPVPPIPIMVHPPSITSDNTLDQWLDAVLASRKGIKLDFKSLRAVGPSLELLKKKNESISINRPVWLNADILLGPNVPEFMPVVNGTGFLLLIEQTFPDVTVSPGWKVTYSPPFTATYTRSMVEDMYEMVKNVSQKVTFPVHALLTRSGWQHISWLLGQSPRFSLTLWQGKTHHPTVNDLLFVRDNSHPARVYYDIYEPTLSAFKEAARQPGRVRRFYPGGDPVDYFRPTRHGDTLSEQTDRDRLDVPWITVTDRADLSSQLEDGGSAMLVVRVASDSRRPGVPVVAGSDSSAKDPLTLQEFVELVDGAARAGFWGFYLRLQTQDVLQASLRLLDAAYGKEQLFRPVWLNMDVHPHRSNAQGSSLSSSPREEFVSAVEELFPHVTLVLPWRSLLHQEENMRRSTTRVALQLRSDSLPGEEGEELDALLDMMDRYDLVVEEVITQRDEKGVHERPAALNAVMVQPGRGRDTRLYHFTDRTF